MIKDTDITKEFIEKVEYEIGMGACAWDMVDPKYIVASIINVWMEECNENKSGVEQNN